MPLGSGEGSSNPLTTRGQLQRWRSPDATDTCRGVVAGVFQMWKGLQMRIALGRELDGRRAAPCRESEPGVSPPRLQYQSAMLLLPPSSPQPAPFLAGDIFFFLCGERWWRQMVSRRKRGSPCFRGTSPQPAVGHCASAPSPYPPPTTAQPGLALKIHRRVSPGSVLLRSALRVPSFPADPPFPSPAFPHNPAPLQDSPRVGAPACLPRSVGGQAPRQGWGAPQAP